MEQQQVQVQVQGQRQGQSAAPVKCPRCDSSNTKFCYYNNYSLSQPRHLCKACKRYWTKGGTLRNVPVGGGCRKNKSLSTTKVTKSSSAFAPLMSSLAKPSITKTHININPYDLNPSYNSIFRNDGSNYDMLLPHYNRGGGGLGFSSAAAVTSQNFGSGNSIGTSSNTQLLSSYPEQENLVFNGFKEDITTLQTIPYGGFLGLDEVQILLQRNEKMDGYGNRMDWNMSSTNYDDQNYIEIDPPFMWNSSTTTGGGVWHHDSSSNINGSSSSVPSLI